MMFIIYKITNSVNGKVYVGKTSKTMEERWHGHLRASNADLHGMLIARAIKKYGPEAFVMEQLATTSSPVRVNTLERRFIRENDCCVLDGPDKGYNMTRGGDGFDSEHVRVQNLLRVAEGTHPWAGERGSALNSATQRKLIAEGRHHFAGEKGSKFARELLKERTEKGTNAWAGEVGSRLSRERALRLLAEGKHHSQQKQTCPHCGKVGAGNSMKKWHFDKCRFKPDQS